MTKVEIVDDAGNEFYVTNIPIPFYIRLKLDDFEDERIKYQAKIIDEAGNTRSFYTGVTTRKFLELHVPVIPLRNYGKISVEIEVSDMGSKNSTKHQATIDYVSQDKYDSLRKLDVIEEIEDEVEGEELDTHTSSEVEELVEKPVESYELTIDELAYLTQRAEILNETTAEKKGFISEQIYSNEQDEEE